MSFNDKEISTQDGRPIALYHFRWGNTEWRYTSADRNVTIDEIIDGNPVAKTYIAKAMSDSGMVQGTSAQNDFTIDGPSDLPIVDLFKGTPPSGSIWLTVRRKHAGETDTPIYWKGNVTNVKRPSLAKCQIVGRPISASLKRTGLRLCWTRECPHFVYGPGCWLNAEDFRVEATVLDADGVTISFFPAVDQPDQYFRGGYVQWEVNEDGTLERRFIENHILYVDPDTTDESTRITIFGLVSGLTEGQTVGLYPGCDHLPDTCDGKFDNLPNYGGFDKMPGKTPFGTSIF